MITQKHMIASTVILLLLTQFSTHALNQKNPPTDCVIDMRMADVPPEVLDIRNKLLASRPTEAVGYLLSLTWSFLSLQDGKEIAGKTITECHDCNEDPREQFKMASETGNINTEYKGIKGRLFYSLTLQWNKDTGDDALATGIVYDQYRQPIEGASVILERQEDGKKYDVGTSPKGLFRTEVRSGNYKVTAQKGSASVTQKYLLCAYGSQRASALGGKYELPFMEMVLETSRCWKGTIHLRHESETREGNPSGHDYWDYFIEAVIRAEDKDSQVSKSLKGTENHTQAKTEYRQDNLTFAGIEKTTVADIDGTVDQMGNYSLTFTIPVEVVLATYGLIPCAIPLGWDEGIQAFYFKKKPLLSGKIDQSGRMQGTISNSFMDEDSVFTVSITWQLDPYTR